jgi:hypothetical protein
MFFVTEAPLCCFASSLRVLGCYLGFASLASWESTLRHGCMQDSELHP